MKGKADMETDSEEENLNQHRRQSLEGLDEIRNRKNRLNQTTKRTDGTSPSRIHEQTQVSDDSTVTIRLPTAPDIDYVRRFWTNRNSARAQSMSDSS